MKSFLLAAFICLIVMACNKSGSSTLTGRWHVINDSLITMGGSVSYDIYNGNDNDYFDFASDGSLYTKENGSDKTYSYEITSANTISMVQTGPLIDAIHESGTYSIKGNKARISISPNLTNPGFSYKRIINLER